MNMLFTLEKPIRGGARGSYDLIACVSIFIFTLFSMA